MMMPMLLLAAAVVVLRELADTEKGQLVEIKQQVGQQQIRLGPDRSFFVD